MLGLVGGSALAEVGSGDVSKLAFLAESFCCDSLPCSFVSLANMPAYSDERLSAERSAIRERDVEVFRYDSPKVWW